MSDIVTSLPQEFDTNIFFNILLHGPKAAGQSYAQGQIIIAISGLGHLGTDVGDGDTMMSNQNPIDRVQPKQWC